MRTIILPTLAVAIFLSVIAIEPALAQAQFPFTGRVKADRVNIRSGQSNNFESLATLNKGDEIVVLGKSYSWYKVRLPEGAKLFIKAEYARMLSAEVGEIAGDKVNIRARSSTDAAIIGQLVRGEQFFVKENDGEWLWIRPVAKAQGWVKEDLIEFKSPQVPAKPFADPTDAAVRARAENDAAQKRRAARFAPLRAVADGQYEVEGTLARTAPAPNATAGYMLTGGVRNETILAYLTGPDDILGNFAGARVTVRGTVKDDPALNAVTLNVVKINLAL